MINKKDIEESVNKKFSSWIILFRGTDKGLQIVSEDIKAHSLSIPLSLLESLEKDVEGMRKKVTKKDYDGNDLDSACSYYNIAALTWDEIVRFEMGYFEATDFVLSLIKQYKEQLK